VQGLVDDDQVEDLGFGGGGGIEVAPNGDPVSGAGEGAVAVEPSHLIGESGAILLRQRDGREIAQLRQAKARVDYGSLEVGRRGVDISEQFEGLATSRGVARALGVIEEALTCIVR